MFMKRKVWAFTAEEVKKRKMRKNRAMLVRISGGNLASICGLSSWDFSSLLLQKVVGCRILVMPLFLFGVSSILISYISYVFGEAETCY